MIRQQFCYSFAVVLKFVVFKFCVKQHIVNKCEKHQTLCIKIKFVFLRGQYHIVDLLDDIFNVSILLNASHNKLRCFYFHKCLFIMIERT